MAKINLKEIIFVCIFLKQVNDSLEETCESLSVNYSQTVITWPRTDDKTISTPPCIGQNKEFLYRECIDGEWGPDPGCSNVQEETLPTCPEGFSKIGKICYIISEPTHFPPKCPFEDVLSFDNYKLITSVSPIWMPVKRDTRYGQGVMQWIEPTSKYKTQFVDYYVSAGDEDCLIYYGESNITSTSCNGDYPAVCAYLMLDDWDSPLCGINCSQSDFLNKTQCICFGFMLDEEITKAEFTDPYQNRIFINQMLEESCSFGLEKVNKTYIWSNSKTEIDYTYWSKNVVFNDSNKYGALTSDGWILTENSLPCTLFVLDVNVSTPSLSLSLANKTFSLTVINVLGLREIEKFPVFCFTDTDAVTITYRYSNLRVLNKDQESMILQFDALNNAPGNHWCEGFTYKNSEVVESNKIFVNLDPNYSEYVVILSVKYNNSEEDPFSQNTINFLDETFFSVLNTFSHQYFIRIMTFLNIDTLNHKVSVNAHVTAEKSTDLEKNDATNVATMLSIIIKDNDYIEMIDFLSADYCYEETVGNLTWLQTPVGTESTPVEFCFRDGTQIRRLCNGSFLDGARWANYQDCEIFPRSSVTNDLVQLLDNSIDYVNTNTKLFVLSRKYQKFKSLDIYLTVQIYNKLFNLFPVSIELLVKTISNVFQVDCDDLEEAQLKLNALDSILTLLDNVTHSCVDDDEDIDFGLNNFAIACSQIEALSGIQIFKDGLFNRLTGSHTINDFMKTESIKSAIWLNPTQARISDYKVSFSVFLSSCFFVQEGRKFRNTEPVFGVALPVFEFVVYILRKLDKNESAEACLQWVYSTNNKGFWKIIGQPQVYSSFVVCEFAHSGYFSLSVKTVENTNVTDSLIDVLESNETVAETMQRLANISEKYQNFKPVDLTYVEKILKKVGNEKNVDLDMLTKTINNLDKINREVLMESQLRNRATDLILEHVDTLVEEYDPDGIIQSVEENFMVVVVDLKKSDFDGLALLERNGCLQLQILNNETVTKNIITNDAFKSGVIINKKLKMQMGDKSKITITFFKNDGFFNEKNSLAKFVSTIFGVTLPQIGEYSAPISVFHKINKDNFSDHCVHWKYDAISSGFWKKDNNSYSNNSDVLQCDFWHTTYFAVLMVDKEKTQNNSFNFLDVVTIVNSLLSILGLTCIILTALLFKNWKLNNGNQILINFALVVLLQIVAFFTSIAIKKYSPPNSICVVIGVLLHYSIISQFCWMLVVAILQFRRLVIVLKAPPKNVLLKTCIFGWVVPIIPVTALVIADKDNYLRSELCYPSGWGLYLGIWLPVSIIIITNTLIFIKIFFNIIRKKVEIVGVGNSDVKYQLQLAILLFFIFGLTWIFGLLANFQHLDIFLYLFCVTTSLQGFVIFLFFIVCNPNTKRLYMRGAKKCCHKP